MEESVHAVVLNWNNYEDTARCLNSLLDNSVGRIHIWLVDNGSTDDSLERFHETFGDTTDVSILGLEKNLGFGSGMNQGIKAALEYGADEVFVLNNDIVFPEEDIIEPLIEKLHKYPSLGSISPVVKYLETGEVKSTGADAVVTIPNEHFAQRREHFQAAIEDPELNYGVSYSACLFTAEALREGGIFPEEYFMYVEDIQHALTLEEAGFHRATHLGVSISHEFHGSTDPHGPLPAYYKTRNWLLLHREMRLEPYAQFIILYGYFVITRAVHRLVTLNFAGLRAIVEGVVDGIREKTGQGPYP